MCHLVSVDMVVQLPPEASAAVDGYNTCDDNQYRVDRQGLQDAMPYCNQN